MTTYTRALLALLFPLVFALPVFAAAATVNIKVGDNFFTPSTATIHEGDTVVWTNSGAMAHTVSGDDGSFDSGNLAPGQSFSQTFAVNGTVGYHCSLHGSAGAGMFGTLSVQAAAAATATTVAVNPASTARHQTRIL
jgi:plastocyanin